MTEKTKQDLDEARDMFNDLKYQVKYFTVSIFAVICGSIIFILAGYGAIYAISNM